MFSSTIKRPLETSFFISRLAVWVVTLLYKIENGLVSTGKFSGIKGRGKVKTIPIKTDEKGKYKHIVEIVLQYKLL